MKNIILTIPNFIHLGIIDKLKDTPFEMLKKGKPTVIWLLGNPCKKIFNKLYDDVEGYIQEQSCCSLAVVKAGRSRVVIYKK